MPAETAKAAHTLEDFAGFLAELGTGGFVYSVIGGCAVAAYARLRGERVTSCCVSSKRRSSRLHDELDAIRASRRFDRDE